MRFVLYDILLKPQIGLRYVLIYLAEAIKLCHISPSAKADGNEIRVKIKLWLEIYLGKFLFCLKNRKWMTIYLYLGSYFFCVKKSKQKNIAIRNSLIRPNNLLHWFTVLVGPFHSNSIFTRLIYNSIGLVFVLPLWD